PQAGPAHERQAAFVQTPLASVAEGHQAQVSAGGRSPPRSRPPLSAAATWLRTRLITRGLGARLAGNDPRHPLAVGLLRLELEPDLLAYHAGKKAPTRVGLQA